MRGGHARFHVCIATVRDKGLVEVVFLPLLPATSDQASWLGPAPTDVLGAPSQGRPQLLRKAGLTVFEFV